MPILIALVIVPLAILTFNGAVQGVNSEVDAGFHLRASEAVPSRSYIFIAYYESLCFFFLSWFPIS